MDNFRLLNFKVSKKSNDNKIIIKGLYHDRPSIIDNISGNEFVFSDLDNDDSDTKKSANLYITLIIGPNGTGKSTLLREISKIFLGLAIKQTPNELPSRHLSIKYEYNLEYLINDARVLIVNGKDFQINGQSCNLQDIPLPKKIIVSTLGISDKFITKSSSPASVSKSIPHHIDSYEYIGAKSDNSSSSSFSFIYRALDLLVESFGRRKSIHNVLHIFDYLHFKPIIEIYYKINNIKSAQKDSLVGINGETLITYVKDIITLKDFLREAAKRRKISRSWLDKVFAESPLMEEILAFILRIKKTGAERIRYNLDFQDNGKTDLSVEEFNVISVLRKLRIAALDAVIVTKSTGASFDLSESSSGEIQILVSFLSFAATIEDGSLVLIDEPEISLHPNWQMLYMKLIYEVFSKTKNCHLLIGTHSHFLVSSLRPNDASVLAITADEGKITSDNIHRHTYGLSTEDVLYNVFNLRTTRNYFFEMEMREALHLVSESSKGVMKGKDRTRLEQLSNKFESLVLDKHDPLNLIIFQIKNKVG